MNVFGQAIDTAKKIFNANSAATAGMIDPSLWDNGIPAFLMNYTVNGSEERYDGQGNWGGSRSRNLFASFRNGLNLGPWRLRSTQTYIYNRQRNEGTSGFSSPAQTQCTTKSEVSPDSERAM
ncbi:hypothetical protein [Photorhabdus bodei]|uniref:hypothetical protein n=1 Tax=Photorhabdus bodei TaxID=2029681 RepID=UPI001EE4478F|nr:hypothetical protein [Photorhabdus bodei]